MNARMLGVLCALSAACGASQPHGKAPVEITPDSLYPLAPGNAWSYDVDAGDGQPVLAITRVQSVSPTGDVAVMTGNEVVHYERRPDGLFRPARQGYLLRAPIERGASWDSGAGTRARVAELDLVVETSAGRFTDCVKVVEEAESGLHVTTTYCPGVGPVDVVAEIALSRATRRNSARLRGYHVAPR